MYAISFAKEFYTLWDYEEYFVNAEKRISAYYIKNLSKDLETAKSKLIGKDYILNFDLKGNRYVYEENNEHVFVYAENEFTIGMLKGENISTSNDVWQLKRAYRIEETELRRSLAKQRLLELGLTEYNLCFYTSSELEQIKHDEFIESLENGHFYNDKEKVTLEVETFNSFSFNSGFGTTFVIEFFDNSGKKFKYKGSNPNSELFKMGKKHKIQATIKHDSYNGKETLLQRIKII